MNKVSGNQKKKKKKIGEPSKSQKRKLKKLQEDKEKELLLSKSMETLEKYKIGDVAQSLMWSSKNLGQVETFQEKRRREVQFCKAGLQLPTNNRPIKYSVIMSLLFQIGMKMIMQLMELQAYWRMFLKLEAPYTSWRKLVIRH